MLQRLFDAPARLFARPVSFAVRTTVAALTAQLPW